MVAGQHYSRIVFPLAATHYSSPFYATTTAAADGYASAPNKQRSTSINNLSKHILKNYSNIAASVSSSLIPTNTLFLNQKLNIGETRRQNQLNAASNQNQNFGFRQANISSASTNVFGPSTHDNESINFAKKVSVQR